MLLDALWTKEKETAVNFNRGLSANRPSNNWALVGSAIQLLNNWGQVPWECCPSDCKLTAVTTNTLPQRVFSSVQTYGLVTSINRYHGFHALAK